MAHPLYHARSAATKYGGPPSDYYELECFLDQSKQLVADCRHRLILHNEWGVCVTVLRFGGSYYIHGKSQIQNLAERHIIEDLGHIPSVEFALAGGIPLVKQLRTDLEQAARTCEQFNLELPRDILAIESICMVHRFLESPYDFYPNILALNLTHCAWGPFLAEQVFGITVSEHEIPTRYICEEHIKAECGGKIVPMTEALIGIKVAGWMCNKAQALSERYSKA